jgi:hypothetical protein
MYINLLINLVIYSSCKKISKLTSQGQVVHKFLEEVAKSLIYYSPSTPE